MILDTYFLWSLWYYLWWWFDDNKAIDITLQKYKQCAEIEIENKFNKKTTAIIWTASLLKDVRINKWFSS